MALPLLGGLGGCIGTLAKTIIAPELVVADGARRVVGSVEQAVSTVDVTPADDISRILAAHPDAENADELRRLQSDLQKRPLGNGTAPTADSDQDPVIDDFDRRQQVQALRPRSRRALPGTIMLGSAPGREPVRRGSVLRLEERNGQIPPRQGEGEPFAASPLGTLPPEVHRSFQMTVQPVRQPGGSESRRKE